MKVKKIYLGIMLTLLLCSLTASVFADTTLKLNETSVTIKVNKNFKLKSLNNTKTKIKWISDNPAVAKVSSKGVVKGIGKGNATIYACSTDGSRNSAYCHVSVKDKKSKTTTISITDSNWNEYIEVVDIPIVFCDPFGSMESFHIYRMYTVKEKYLKRLVPEKSYYSLDLRARTRQYFISVDENDIGYTLLEPLQSQEEWEEYDVIYDNFNWRQNIVTKEKGGGCYIWGVTGYGDKQYKYDSRFFGKLMFTPSSICGCTDYDCGARDGRLYIDYPVESLVARATGELCLKK